MDEGVGGGEERKSATKLVAVVTSPPQVAKACCTFPRATTCRFSVDPSFHFLPSLPPFSPDFKRISRRKHRSWSSSPSLPINSRIPALASRHSSTLDDPKFALRKGRQVSRPTRDLRDRRTLGSRISLSAVLADTTGKKPYARRAVAQQQQHQQSSAPHLPISPPSIRNTAKGKQKKTPQSKTASRAMPQQERPAWLSPASNPGETMLGQWESDSNCLFPPSISSLQSQTTQDDATASSQRRVSPSRASDNTRSASTQIVHHGMQPTEISSLCPPIRPCCACTYKSSQNTSPFAPLPNSRYKRTAEPFSANPSCP